MTRFQLSFRALSGRSPHWIKSKNLIRITFLTRVLMGSAQPRRPSDASKTPRNLISGPMEEHACHKHNFDPADSEGFKNSAQFNFGANGRTCMPQAQLRSRR